MGTAGCQKTVPSPSAPELVQNIPEPCRVILQMSQSIQNTHICQEHNPGKSEVNIPLTMPQHWLLRDEITYSGSVEEIPELEEFGLDNFSFNYSIL